MSSEVSETIGEELLKWCKIVDAKKKESSAQTQFDTATILESKVVSELELIDVQMSLLNPKNSQSLSNGFPILDTTSQAVDRLWNTCQNYSNQQIEHLLDLISSTIYNFILKFLENVNPFEINRPNHIINLAEQFVLKWIQQTTDSTTRLWTQSFGNRKWTSSPYSYPQLNDLKPSI